MMPLRSYLIPLAAGLLIIAIGRAHAAEPVVRLNVALTCPDIQALVAWRGWDEIERRARSAGATEIQIKAAKRCVASK